MKHIAPDYYLKFRCIGGKCRHNCCIGWEIDIDEDTLHFYQSVGGELGEQLRKNICTTDDPPHFILGEHERCPFLNKDNLCDLIIAQGEGALCQICDDHPRFYNEWNNSLEMGVGLCCEEAARLVLSGTAPVELVTVAEDEEEAQPSDAEEALFLHRARLFDALWQDFPLDEKLTQVLEMAEITLPDKSFGQWAAFYQTLEQLDPAWYHLLEKLKLGPSVLPDQQWDGAFARLAHYFIYRHASGVEDAYEYSLRVAFAVLSVRMIRALCGVLLGENGELTLDDVAEMARMYSSEVEYSDENAEAILDAIAGY